MSEFLRHDPAVMRVQRRPGTVVPHPVLAAADGQVVVVLDEEQEDATLLQKAGEPLEAYVQRIVERQNQQLARGARGIVGNHIVIRHGRRGKLRRAAGAAAAERRHSEEQKVGSRAYQARRSPNTKTTSDALSTAMSSLTATSSCQPDAKR